MKNSGIEWIGEIPNKWKVERIGTHFSTRNVKVSDSEYPPLSVTKQGILPQLDDVAKTKNNDDRRQVKAGDFVINSRSDRKQSCGVSPLDGSVSLINTVLIHRGNILPCYTKYLLKNYAFAEEFYRWGTGIVADLWSTKWESMKRIMIPVPDKGEQQKIAEILDEKCGKIDKLIDNEQKQIEKMKEYKQSVITSAVTKGLDKSVPLKDSGIEWIGEIPENWNVFQLKNISTIKTGHTPSTAHIENFNGNVNWYTPGDFVNETIENSSRKISEYALQNEGITLFPVNTTLLVGIGGTAGKVCRILVEGYSNQQITALMANDKVDPVYLFYELTASMRYLKDNAMYTTLPIINNGYLGSLEFVIPNIKTQKEIADYLDEKCSKIDEVISIKQRKIEKLQEYKKSLIYEYVTGKKEVV